MFRLVIFLIVYLPIVKIRNVQGLVVVLLPTRSWSLVALWRVKFHTLNLLGKWASWDMGSTNIMYHTKHQVTCPWVCTYFKLFLKFSYICVGTFVNSHQLYLNWKSFFNLYKHATGGTRAAPAQESRAITTALSVLTVLEYKFSNFILKIPPSKKFDHSKIRTLWPLDR